MILNWGIMLLYALLPVYLLKTEIAGIPTTALELLTYAAAAAVLASFFLKPDFRTGVLQRLKKLWNENRGFVWTAVIFLGAMAVAAVVTVDLRRSLGVFKGWFFDPMLAAILLYLIARGVKDLTRLVLGLNIMAASLSLYGLWEFFTPPTVLTSAVDYNAYLSRLNSIFQSANYHAFLVAPVVVLTMGVLFWNWQSLSKIFKIIAIGSLVFNVWSLMLTQSYGAFLGIFLAGLFILLALPSSGGRLKTVRIIRTGFLAAVLLSLVVVTNSAKFQRDFNNLSGDSSLRGRIEVWDTSLYIIKSHPVFGLGLGNFDEGYVKYVSEVVKGKPLEDVVIHAHNIFLNFWNESGILGLIAFILLLVMAFRLLPGAKEADKGLALGAAAGLIQILGHGLIDTPYFKNDASYLFWLLIAILLVLKNSNKNDTVTS